MANLDPFYQSLLIAWHNINPIPITTYLPARLLRKMPLYDSMIIGKSKLQIIPDWKVCGFKNLEKLLEENGSWTTLQLQHLPIIYQRRISYNYNQIKMYFNNKIIIQDPAEEMNQIKFQFKLPHQEKYCIFPSTKKMMYLTSLKAIMTKPEVTGKSAITTKKFNWMSLYFFPIDKRDSDISWRLLHNALVTPKKLTEWNIIRRKNCPWCLDREANILHMIFHCRAAKAVWSFASNKICIINGIPPPLSLHHAMTGFSPKTQEAKLSNFILSLVKSTIYRTYVNLIKEEAPPPPAYLQIFKRRLQYRIKLEEAYSKITKTSPIFSEHFLQSLSL